MGVTSPVRLPPLLVQPDQPELADHTSDQVPPLSIEVIMWISPVLPALMFS